MIDFSARHYASRTHEKMREVLLDPTARVLPCTTT